MDVTNQTKILNINNENERQISSRNGHMNMSPPYLEAVRSKPLIKIEKKERSPVVQEINDLDFGYMEELEKRKMFMMIRLGHIKDPSKLTPVHNYNKIPVLPFKKQRKTITPSPKQTQNKMDLITNIPLPMFSMKILEDPYQIQGQHKSITQKLAQKQKRLNIINKRILDKFRDY
ncbi:unnamed protein product [Paramecium pentaurelia]|uniref:Uncharacterized protein n=1 Tax=Paramecium pentaurelia TaxID=43138 RepID=A0A8S1XEL2_9CILI|nr:unnamed protein product [Paramecium pentaurelia]